MKWLKLLVTQEPLNEIEETGLKSDEYSPENYSKPDYGEITYWDKRRVLGGNSSLAGTPDGLAGPAVEVLIREPV